MPKYLHPYHAADHLDSGPSKQERIDRVRLLQAQEEASLSNCVKHNVGAIITDSMGRIIATGYNGTPSGMTNCCDHFQGFGFMMENLSNQEKFYRNKSTPEGDKIADKYRDEAEALCARHHEWSKKHELHAEVNVLLHSSRENREGGTLYVNLQPCAECAKMIAGSGILRVVFGIPYHRSDNEQVKALFKKRGIEYILIPNLLE